jgi:hypothetical protein
MLSLSRLFKIMYLNHTMFLGYIILQLSLVIIRDKILVHTLVTLKYMFSVQYGYSYSSLISFLIIIIISSSSSIGTRA